MKPTVHYKPHHEDMVVVGLSAFVLPIDHPGDYVSNTGVVRTSRVVASNPETGEFETLNTLYKPYTE